MKSDPYVRTLLLLITVLLGWLAVRPLATPRKVQAQQAIRRLYIEPGTTSLTTPDGSQNVMGKVVIDLDSGNIWGFPTNRPEPYPRAGTTSQPPVVSPVYLGRYDFDAMSR